jgi:hypothetical protein
LLTLTTTTAPNLHELRALVEIVQSRYRILRPPENVHRHAHALAVLRALYFLSVVDRLPPGEIDAGAKWFYSCDRWCRSRDMPAVPAVAFATAVIASGDIDFISPARWAYGASPGWGLTDYGIPPARDGWRAVLATGTLRPPLARPPRPRHRPAIKLSAGRVAEAVGLPS